MCGRFTLTAPADELASHFEAPDPPLLTPRCDVAPSQVIAVVGLKPGGKKRGIALLTWGFVPYRSENPDKGPRPVNVRAESIAWKFGGQLREKRCLIPASGFCEWRAVGGKKRACHFTMKSGDVFAFAGLWDLWVGESRELLTCTTITTAPNDLVRAVHGRMPVVSPKENYAEWLDHETPEKRPLELLTPYPADEMTVSDASPLVNSPKHDGPECLVA